MERYFWKKKIKESKEVQNVKGKKKQKRKAKTGVEPKKKKKIRKPITLGRKPFNLTTKDFLQNHFCVIKKMRKISILLGQKV
jgi:hypothetical protein